ncbi:uncharacterized protein LOC126373216 [Pectinophora gossypiella]|uniref:Uncharacterized protein n=1 Tax=Pectinophora gossypiella TaxID=13191 RepID=A0A1E1WM02_PECGO|nr:uncharacterized protein LOC126373216 [Pectinophora gossypiella]
MDLAFWPRISKCCCCFNLRTGSLLIGYVSLFISTLSMAAISWSLYAVVAYMRAHKHEPELNGHPPEEVARVALSLYISHAYYLLVLMYYTVISVLLIVGVHRNRSLYLRYYFNSALVLLVLASALVVVSLVFFGVLATIPLLKWCIILFYCLVVVRSAYQEMEEQNKPRVYEMHNIYNPQHTVPLI